MAMEEEVEVRKEHTPIKRVKLDLVGLDGNAFALLGAFSSQARKEGWTKDEIDAVKGKAMSGSYDNLLVTLMDYCDSETEADN